MKLFLPALLLLSFAAFSQDEIETSPDQFETPSTVPALRFQMENRFTHQKENKGTTNLTIPSVNWKLGVSTYVEINMTTNFIYNKVQDSTASGLEPVFIGAKIRLLYNKKWIPDAAITTQIQLPKLASKKLQVNYPAPRLVLHFKNKINNFINLGYTLGTEWDGEITTPAYTYTISPKFKLSEKLECFTEAYGYLTKRESPEHWADAGLMYLVTKDIQLEISGSYELTSDNHFHRYYQLLGIAFRI